MTGYDSKRAAAQDKLDDDDTQVYNDDVLTIAYQSGYYDGKKAAQRPWVELTDDEVLQIRENLQVVEGISLLENLTKAIGAALRSKNT